MKYKIPLKREHWPLVGFVTVFAVIGTFLLYSSHAATPYVSLNASSGTLGGGATLQTDSSASSGQYVKFGSASGGGNKMVVGLNAGGNDTVAQNVAGAVKYDRFDTEEFFPQDILGGLESADGQTGSQVKGLASLGIKVDLLFSGPYTYNNGVSTLTNTSVKESNGTTVDGITNWVTNTLSYYQQYCNPTECPSLEVLNEPAGWWFWGTGSSQSALVSDSANADDYAKLVQATYVAFHQAYPTNAPLILATVDGSSGVSWGSEWWNYDSSVLGNSSSYVDGVIVHPYGGNDTPSQSKLGNRTLVTSANTTFNKPVYVTEVGWPTDTSGDTPTTTNATGDSMQWPQENCLSSTNCSSGANQGDQCDNVYNFINWARGTNYVNGVYIFGYEDYGTNDFYGMFTSGGTAKPAYNALKAAANLQPNPCPNPISY